MAYSGLFPEGTACNLQKDPPVYFKYSEHNQLFTDFTVASLHAERQNHGAGTFKINAGAPLKKVLLPIFSQKHFSA